MNNDKSNIISVKPLPRHAVAQGNRVNAEWLRIYLVHTRLTSRPLGSIIQENIDKRLSGGGSVYNPSSLNTPKRAASVSSESINGGRGRMRSTSVTSSHR